MQGMLKDMLVLKVFWKGMLRYLVLKVYWVMKGIYWYVEGR